MGYSSNTQGLAQSRGSPASQQHHSHLSTTTTDDALNAIWGCTYRHFLALRRAAVAIAHTSVGGFALGRAFHFE